MYYIKAIIAVTPIYEITKNTINETHVNTRCDFGDWSPPQVTKNDHKPFAKWNTTAIIQII